MFDEKTDELWSTNQKVGQVSLDPLKWTFSGDHILVKLLPARRYASAGNSDRNVSVRLSVCPSVCHAPVLCQNEES